MDEATPNFIHHKPKARFQNYEWSVMIEDLAPLISGEPDAEPRTTTLTVITHNERGVNDALTLTPTQHIIAKVRGKTTSAPRSDDVRVP